MMKVKITNGIYGYRKPGAKHPDPKHAGDVVDLPDEEAVRLEHLKVGIILGAAEEHPAEPVATPPADENGDGQGVDKGEGENAADGVVIPDTLDIVDGHFTENGLMAMTRADMEQLAEDLGVDVSKCKNKSEIAKLLAAVDLELGDDNDSDEDDGDEDDGDEDDGPALGAAPPVV